MRQDLKERWLAALRSGNYKQGRDFMHKGYTYCCLGVLCEVAGAQWTRPDPESQVFRCQYGESFLTDGEGQVDLDVLAFFKLPAELHKLAYSMNDGTISAEQKAEYGLEERPYSFAEIADKLEPLL